MSNRRRHNPILVSASDFGPEILDPTTGELRYAIPIEIEDVAVGTRATVRRAKRADPLNRVADCTKGMRDAAALYVRALEHTEAGIGLGPVDTQVERVQETRRGDGLGVALLPQERAISAAEWLRRGAEAMGDTGRAVVLSFCVAGCTLDAIDREYTWRNGGARAVMLRALERLAVEYGCE